MPAIETRSIAGPAGRLDSRWHGPRGGPPVLLLHPHPLFGGTMGTRLLHDLATALADAGHRAVRVDFRGVGRSEGTYGEGDGEAVDAAAAFDALAAEAGQVPAVVGYSFGAAVACRLARERLVRRLVLVGVPVDVVGSRLHPLEDAPVIRAPADAPVAIVIGDRDPFVTPVQAQALAARFQPPARLEVLQGAGHFLEPSRNSEAVAAVLRALA